MAEETATPPELTDDETPIESEAPEGLEPEALERREAALAQVVKFGDPVLRSAASPVTDFDEDLAADGERMVGLMRDAIGVGLAATQLGILRRLLVFQAGGDAPPTLLVNPKIEWASEELASAEEGCLSLPGIIVDVERSLHVRVTGLDASGEPIVIEGSGLEARVLQHEIDHLDGVLMIDRTTKEHRRGALRALREGTTYAPEPPEPPEGDEVEPQE
jgi:peptide deformylase